MCYDHLLAQCALHTAASSQIRIDSFQNAPLSKNGKLYLCDLGLEKVAQKIKNIIPSGWSRKWKALSIEFEQITFFVQKYWVAGFMVIQFVETEFWLVEDILFGSILVSK